MNSTTTAWKQQRSTSTELPWPKTATQTPANANKRNLSEELLHHEPAFPSFDFILENTHVLNSTELARHDYMMPDFRAKRTSSGCQMNMILPRWITGQRD